MKKHEIIALLPYSPPFLFVDKLTKVSENGAEGFYIFKEDEYFYQGHFKDNPVTPGVILTEVMAQIGVVCLGIYLLKDELGMAEKPKIALTSNEVDFFLPVFPGEKVKVISEKATSALINSNARFKCSMQKMNWSLGERLREC